MSGNSGIYHARGKLKTLIVWLILLDWEVRRVYIKTKLWYNWRSMVESGQRITFMYFIAGGCWTGAADNHPSESVLPPNVAPPHTSRQTHVAPSIFYYEHIQGEHKTHTNILYTIYMFYIIYNIIHVDHTNGGSWFVPSILGQDSVVYQYYYTTFESKF